MYVGIAKATHQSPSSSIDCSDFGVLCELVDVRDFADVFDTFTLPKR
jgi:hypothetical protein